MPRYVGLHFASSRSRDHVLSFGVWGWRMRLVHFGVILVVHCLGAQASAADPLWHRSAVLAYRVGADGTASADEVWDVRADSRSVAHSIAQQSYSYVADLEDVELIEAYTLKQDGTKTPVGAGAVLPLAVTTTAAAPQFSATVSRTIVFPAVDAGDTVHYVLRRRGVATLFPGHLTLALAPGPRANLDRVDISLAIPGGLDVRIATAGLEEISPESAPEVARTRRWRLSAAGSGPVTLEASSLPGYAALGDAYAQRAWPQSQPGPAVRALAERLTAGASTPREQARRLYDYVAAEIRYVALFFGQGRIVPRPAETVLAEGFGDCKDHTALLQALLAAKGIASYPALLSLRETYVLPEVAGLSALDHVITYVPALDLYLDTTAPFAPFGLLPPDEYDKPVVLALPTGSRLARIPPMQAGAMRVVTRTRAQIGEDDVVSGETVTVAAGPQAIELRSMAAWVEGRGTAIAAAAKLRQLGTPGTGSFDFGPPGNEAGEYRMAARFILDEPLTDEGEAPFPIPGGLRVFERPGRLLVGRPTEEGGRACYPGRETEEVALELPSGTRLASVPKDVSLTLGGASYMSHYSVADGVLRVQREFAVETAHQSCTAAEYGLMRGVLAAARRDQRVQIALIRGSPSRTVDRQQ